MCCQLGRTSATYDIGIFDKDTLAARGHWVHVYVDPATGRPAPMAPLVRDALTTLAVDHLE